MSRDLPIFCDECGRMVDGGDFDLGPGDCLCPPNTPASEATHPVLLEVAEERAAQTRRWGVQNHPDARPRSVEFLGDRESFLAHHRRMVDSDAERGESNFSDILMEEFLEAEVEALRGDKAALRVELIQVAAVAVAWVEKLDRETKG